MPDMNVITRFNGPPPMLGRAHLSRLFTADDWSSEPTPPESAVIRAAGPDPLQVLLIGGGVALGYGVASQELALAGHLARQIAILTGRGVDLDVSVVRRATISRIRRLAEAAHSQWYDAVVLSVGVQDVLGGTNTDLWGREMDALISHFCHGQVAQPELFLTGVPDLSESMRVSRLSKKSIDWFTEHVNDQLLSLSESRAGIHFLSLGSAPSGLGAGARSGETYRSWAALMSPGISQVIADRGHESSKPVEEDARAAAVRALRILDTPSDERFDRIVATARDRFRCAAAGLSFMDGDRQWFKSMIGLDLSETARGTSLCEWTITAATPFVVPDTVHDARFKSMAIVTEGHVRAYAGHPVLDHAGTPVGVFCVLYDEPHAFSAEDLRFLRELAGLVETLLVAA